MTTQHTPTPWTFCADTYNRLAIQAADGSFVADMIHEYGAPAAENAAFIVRACNAHDELVAALRCIDAALNQNKTFPADVELARAECRAALAKVTK